MALTRSQVAPIRVVLATMPALLGDIVRDTLAANHDDVAILAEVETRGEIASAVRRTDADVAVLGVASQDDLSDFLGSLLADHPRLAVIALASDGRNGCVYRLKPISSAIEDVSPASLMQAIRATAAMDVHPVIHPFSAR